MEILLTSIMGVRQIRLLLSGLKRESPSGERVRTGPVFKS